MIKQFFIGQDLAEELEDVRMLDGHWVSQRSLLVYELEASLLRPRSRRSGITVARELKHVLVS